MTENKDSVDCKLFATGDEAAAHGPGAIVWEDGGANLFTILPGTKDLTCLPVTRDPNLNQPRVWWWDGNKESPTLTPSIHMVGEWHGFLRNGRLESC